LQGITFEKTPQNKTHPHNEPPTHFILVVFLNALQNLEKGS